MDRYEILNKAKYYSDYSEYDKANEYHEMAISLGIEDLPKKQILDIYRMLYHNHWMINNYDKSKYYFDLCMSKINLGDIIDEQDYLEDYPLFYEVPIIYVLDNWLRSSDGKYDIWGNLLDIYPKDKLIFITNIEDVKDGFVISANKRFDKMSILRQYLYRIKGSKSDLYTKDEYIDKFLNSNYLNIAIKNFNRLEESKMVALSIKHFVPEARVTLFNFYDDRKNINYNSYNFPLFNDVVHCPTKYLLGMNPPKFYRNNGLFYGEAFNVIHNYYKSMDGKLIILDEHNFFLNGLQLQELIENDFDFAWAEWYNVAPNMYGGFSGYINGSMVGFNPKNMKDFFPMPEQRELFETVLTNHFLLKDGFLKYKMKTKYLNDFNHDGFYTNDTEIMKLALENNNIPTFLIDKSFLDDVKFFIGPMSVNVVDSIRKFSNDYSTKIGLIASRRQIDFDSGYVGEWNTKKFSKYASDKNLILCRDHGGIGQGSSYDNGVLSLIEDAKYFKILHIDPFVKYKNYESILKETIDMIKTISLINDTCLFEVGTEEAIFPYDEKFLDKFLSDLKNNLGLFFERIAYCVIQSGTKIFGIKNIGKFNPEKLVNMVEICRKYGLKSKEHNGDYLTKEEIQQRFDLGLDSINIAPEFGVFETEVILEYITNAQKEKLFEICLKSNKWRKWVEEGYNPYKNQDEIIKISGHYQYSTEEFKALNIKLDDIIKDRLYEKIKNLIL